MATGKELVRMMTCSIWTKFVMTKVYFVNAVIYDRDGNIITLEKATRECFCKVKILILKKYVSKGYVELLGAMLRLVASTSSESMALEIKEYPKTYEIIID